MSLSVTVHVIVHPSLLAPGALETLAAKLSDCAPILAEVGTLMEEDIGENFRTQGFGQWAPLKESTVRDRFRRGYGPNAPLVRSGALLAGLAERGAEGHKFLVDRNSIIVGVYGEVIPYAGRLAKGDAHMPGRILIQVQSGTVERAVQMITEWLGGGPSISVYADEPLYS